MHPWCKVFGLVMHIRLSFSELFGAFLCLVLYSAPPSSLVPLLCSSSSTRTTWQDQTEWLLVCRFLLLTFLGLISSKGSLPCTSSLTQCRRRRGPLWAQPSLAYRSFLRCLRIASKRYLGLLTSSRILTSECPQFPWWSTCHRNNYLRLIRTLNL